MVLTEYDMHLTSMRLYTLIRIRLFTKSIFFHVQIPSNKHFLLIWQVVLNTLSSSSHKKKKKKNRELQQP